MGSGHLSPVTWTEMDSGIFRDGVRSRTESTHASPRLFRDCSRLHAYFLIWFTIPDYNNDNIKQIMVIINVIFIIVTNRPNGYSLHFQIYTDKGILKLPSEAAAVACDVL